MKKEVQMLLFQTSLEIKFYVQHFIQICFYFLGKKLGGTGGDGPPSPSPCYGTACRIDTHTELTSQTLKTIHGFTSVVYKLPSKHFHLFVQRNIGVFIWGASCLKIGGQLSWANCPGGELSGYLCRLSPLSDMVYVFCLMCKLSFMYCFRVI